MQNEATQSATMVKNLDMTANPAPLGLVGFGMTTVLLNLHNAGFFALGSMILAMGIFYGGLAQIIAGIEEWKKNNTFGATAFTSYGLFWLTLVALLVLPKMGLADAPDKTAMAAYLAMWGIFTAVMFIGTLKTNRTLQLVFATLTILFFLLAIGEATGNGTITVIAGYEGIICGFLAIYAGLAQVLNEMYKKTVAPLG
ncbi:MAG: acetate uptake transporter [Methanoregula sp.]